MDATSPTTPCSAPAALSPDATRALAVVREHHPIGAYLGAGQYPLTAVAELVSADLIERSRKHPGVWHLVERRGAR